MKRIGDPIKSVVDHVGRNVTPSKIFLLIPDKTESEVLSSRRLLFCEVDEGKWRAKS